jgi:hypothetical protein
MVNVEAVQQVLAQIEAHPDLHDQATFEFSWQDVEKSDASSLRDYRDERGLDENWCGTTRCIAGWALFFKYGKGWGNEVQDPSVNIVNAPTRSIVNAAAQALGLTVDQAYDIFFEYRDTVAIQKLKELLW